jgi:hypothetical protein
MWTCCWVKKILCRNPAVYWSKWHMLCSTWFKYMYICIWDTTCWCRSSLSPNMPGSLPTYVIEAEIENFVETFRKHYDEHRNIIEIDNITGLSSGTETYCSYALESSVSSCMSASTYSSDGEGHTVAFHQFDFSPSPFESSSSPSSESSTGVNGKYMYIK